MQILIVEDQPRKSLRIREVLSGFEGVNAEAIVVVGDAASAKRELRNRFFDLAIIDIAIPGRLGGEVQRDAGLRLVADLLADSDEFHQPLHMLGLTAFEELTNGPEDIPRSVFSIELFDETGSLWIRALELRVRQVAAVRVEIAADGARYRSTLGIVCALETPELSSVLKLPWDWSEEIIPRDPTIYHKGSFRSGDVDHVVVAAASSRMGLTAAAVAATKLISTFRPQFLAMVGIAAGVPGRVELGDVIVGDPVWDWGSGKWTMATGILKFEPLPHYVDIDATIRNRFRRLAVDVGRLALIKDAFEGNTPKTELKIRVGPLASGAAVLADGETLARILEQNRGVLGVDMEAYSVLAAARESATPLPMAFVLKSVVDFADGRKDDSFQRYAAHCSANVLRVLVEDYCATLVGPPVAV